MSIADADMPVLSPEGVGSLDSLRDAFARHPRPAARTPEEFEPVSLTVAVSREAGSRGGTIARRAGRKLGWQVYNQELLEYLAQERHLSRDLFDSLEAPAAAWVVDHVERLLKEQNLSQNSSVVEIARVILALAIRGEAIILGRGAGCILPAASTLHVRIVSPLADRIAYMSQLERLTQQQAEEQVHQRDRRRSQFVETHFHRKPTDPYQYDLIVNSGKLGEELSAQLIEQAALAKLAARGHDEGAPPATSPEPLG